MAKTKFDNIKNRVLLVVIVFLLSYLLTALIDKERIYYVVFRRRTVVCRLYDRFRRVVADKFRIRGTICLL